MTDLEFDVLDELYFIRSFQEIQDQLALDRDTLKAVLQKLLSKGWVSCFCSPLEEIPFAQDTFEEDFHKYHYLATKAGLLAHNQSDG